MTDTNGGDGPHGISPTTDSAGRTLVIAMDDDLSSRFTAFRCQHPDVGSNEEAARHILRMWLTENGFNGAHGDDGRRPDMLNASNDD